MEKSEEWLGLSKLMSNIACPPYRLCSIGKGLGYKRSELSALDEGSTLVIGGKEIEVQNICTAKCTRWLAPGRQNNAPIKVIM